MAETTNTVELAVRLRCFTRREGKYWVAGCPSLDVFSQASTRKGARKALEEAVHFWLDSCLERNTLGPAMTELGWHRIPAGVGVPTGIEYLGVNPLEPAENVLGEPFPLEVTIPAYQAAALLGQSGAPC